MAQQALPGKPTVPDAILNIGRKRELATPNSTGLRKAPVEQGSPPPHGDVWAVGLLRIFATYSVALTYQLANRHPDASVSCRHLRFSPGESGFSSADRGLKMHRS